MVNVTINGISFDPAAQPEVSSAEVPGPLSSKYILVQTSGPLNQVQRQRLADAGAEILEYVPENTFICRYTGADLKPVRALDFVVFANVYMKQFKIAPTFVAGPATTKMQLRDIAPTGTQSTDPVAIRVVLQRGVPATDELVGEIAAQAGADPSQLHTGPGWVQLTVERRRLSAIAAIDDVRNIEPYLEPRLMSNIARTIMTIDSGSAAAGINGENQVIAVCDTGLDRGDVRDLHPAFSQRVLKLYALGRNVADDPNGHGTHVCGCAVGSGVLNDGTQLQGAAPAASLIIQSVLDSDGGLGGIPLDLSDLFGPVYQNDGVRIHTNSWGTSANGVYTTLAADVDAFVWQYRDMLICFAAGNDGTDAASTGQVSDGSIGSPACAKNCIAVGASESSRPGFTAGAGGPLFTYGYGWPESFPAEPLKSDPVADDPNRVAAFSSRGPAANARVKPDVVAPGTAILSTRSRVASGVGWGLSADPLYFFEGGSSMATPFVAGCAAIVRQYLQQAGIATPSAALLKATLINGAVPIDNQNNPPDLSALPDNGQGFGRVDLTGTLGLASNSVQILLRDEATELDTGDEETIDINLAAPFTGLLATLVWTDAPGEGLQADLDLVVSLPDGSELHGNMPAASDDFDRVNTIEQVRRTDLEPGLAHVTVRAYRVTNPQNYALVVRTF
jgi:serine protease AprX